MLGDRVLAVGEIRSGAKFFNYEAKYQAASTQEIFPADLPDDIVTAISAAARQAADVLRIRHYCRADFIVTPGGKVFVLGSECPARHDLKELVPAIGGCGRPSLRSRMRPAMPDGPSGRGFVNLKLLAFAVRPRVRPVLPPPRARPQFSCGRTSARRTQARSRRIWRPRPSREQNRALLIRKRRVPRPINRTKL